MRTVHQVNDESNTATAGDHRGTFGRILSRVVVLLVIAATARLSQAQNQSATQTPPSAEATVNLEQIQSRIAELQQQAELTGPLQTELDLLEQTVNFLNQAEQARQRLAELESTISEAPQRVRSIEADLKQPDAAGDQPVPAIDPRASEQELAFQLEEARSQLEALKLEDTQQETELASLAQRADASPTQLAEARQRLGEIQRDLEALATADEPAELAAVRRDNLLAEQRLRNARIALLENQTAGHDSLVALAEAQHALAEQKIARQQQRVETLQEALNQRRTTVAEQALQVARAALAADSDAPRPVRTVRQQTVELADEYAEVVTRAQQRSHRRAQAAQLFTKWSDTFSQIKRQVDEIGLTDFIGLRLRNQRNRLPDLGRHQRYLSELADEIQRAQRRRYELEDLQQQIREKSLTNDSPALLAAYTARQELLATLIDAYQAYITDTLQSLHENEHALVELIGAYRDYIDERILWIQSADPWSFSDVPAAGQTLARVFAPNNWSQLITVLWSDAKRRPVVIGLALAVFLLLLGLQRKLRQRLRTIAAAVGKLSTDRYLLTVRACLVTVLIAAVWPLLLWIIGWRLSAALGASPFVIALGVGLIQAAISFFSLELLRQICRPRGLGEVHFRWRAANLRLIRRHLRWLLPLGVVIAFLYAFIERAGNLNELASLGRTVFIIAMIAASLFIYLVLHPQRGILHEKMVEHRDGWLERLKFLWFGGLVLIPLALAVTAIAGYFYTATQLARSVFATGWFVLLVVIGHALALRWLFITQRKMAIKQAKQKRAAQAKAAEQARQAEAQAAGKTTTKKKSSMPGDIQKPLEESDLDVAAISGQTRRFLNIFVAIVVIAGVVVLWSDVLPAFGILREVELWSTVQTVPQTITGVDGQQITENIQATLPVTLADIVASIIIVIITVIVARNIPGLLEIILLQRLPITAGARYAVSTVARYALVIVGIVFAFGAIEIGWSNVQWLAAAITVGLGFGLQEIFANFVSGLIILFERPIRIGDTVTVGNISGTVSRIKMRATTITDWDRKELIIPNKEFITGQVINWTLSDPRLRVNIPVGVSYGADITLARETLLGVADEHAVVLADPPPRALFLGFGDSTLNFELRVFIPHIDHIINIKDDMHHGITQAFRKKEIEIAFPQRDLHIRSVQTPFEFSQQNSPQSEQHT